jgi:16S rRNA (uracil1498-N3)-methyltransferase
MSERFFLASPPQGGRATLVGDEARHLTRVLRARVGDAVRVFDGSGLEWPARVAAIGRDEVELALGEPAAGVVADARLTLAVALPKGERQKWLVEKLTELGVARLVPLDTERGVAEATPAALERLRRGVIEASKQCGRNTLMEIGAPVTLEVLVAARSPATLGIVAHPGGEALGRIPAATPAADIIAAVGPEGGFTDAEVAAATAGGFHAVSLGPHVLRVETAAVALAARLA